MACLSIVVRLHLVFRLVLYVRLVVVDVFMLPISYLVPEPFGPSPNPPAALHAPAREFPQQNAFGSLSAPFGDP